MKKSFYLTMHALVWTVAIGITILLGWDDYSGFYIFSNAYFGVNALLAVTWMLVTFYTFYSFVFPRYFKTKKYVLFFIISLIIVGVYPLLFDLTFGTICLLFKRGHGIGYISSYAYYGGIIAVVFIGGLGCAFRMVIDWFTFAQEKAELEKQNLNSELQLLKYKLNPHFLFNTLNNIDSLISEDSSKASQSLNKLSEIMRYMIYDAEKETVPLAEEIKNIENYIHLQKMRMSYPENITFKVNGDTDSMIIAPMLFMPLVENAFKHSSLNKKNNQISILFEVKNKMIHFDCTNTLPSPPIEKDKTSGIGLPVVKKRLQLIYPESHELQVNKTKDQYQVILKIDTDAN